MERFKPKTEQELQKQVATSTKTLGQELVPSLLDERSILSLEEIKSKYPERYHIYLRLLKAERNQVELDEDDLKEMQMWISALNRLDSYIVNHTPHYEGYEAREKKQLDVFEDIRDALESGQKEGYVKLPTGVGKTVLFAKVVESLGLQTLIVVPSKILVGQTGVRLEEFTDIEFGKYFQDDKNLSHDVVVTTYASLIRGVREGSINPDDFQVLILDEAHNALGEKTHKTIKKFKGVKLGFTATIKYSENKHISDLLGYEIHSMGITEAAREGLISRFKSYIAYSDTDLSGVTIRNNERYDENELERAINKEARNQSAVDLYKSEFDGQLAIAYCGGVAHAQRVAQLFNESGVPAEVISGETPDSTTPDGKEGILNRFNSGEIKVLCNARILIEGFDEPKASVCLNLQPTLSLVDVEQRAGRVLRIDPNNKDKWAYIVDFIDRDPRVIPKLFAEIVGLDEVGEEQTVPYETDSEYAGKQSQDRIVERKAHEINVEGLRVVTDTKEVMTIVSAIMEARYEIAPEGWKHTFDIAKETNRASATIKKAVGKYRNEHPEWFKEYRSALNGGIYEYFSPTLARVIVENYTGIDTAPDGWMTISQLKDELGGSIPRLQRIANSYRTTHPEWFKDCLDTRNLTYEFLAPELLALIREHIRTSENIPEGWQNLTNVAQTIGRSPERVKRRADFYREKHPEWFKVYSPARNQRTVEYYSPELIHTIINDLNAGLDLDEAFQSDIEKIPEGWMTPTQSAEKLAKSVNYIRKIASLYQLDHPEWFREYRDKEKIKHEFYAPELILTLETHIKESIETKEAPDGWLTENKIVEASKFSASKIAKIIARYKIETPQSFKEYRDSGGRTWLYVAPETVEKILSESNKIEKAPEGWLTPIPVARQLDKDPKAVSKRAEEYRSSRADWFRFYLDQGGRSYEHYSPELIAELERRFAQIEDAPEGWMYNNALATMLGKKRERIKQITDSYRDSNPEWFRMYKESRGREIEHFSPELVAIIERTLKSKYD